MSDKEEVNAALAGTLVSSLHRLKDTDNNDGGFFVFGDLSVKVEGNFRLQFTLYEVRDKEVEFIKSIQSDSFTVYASKNWPGMAESTFLTRSFSDQGVRLRLRKEPRFRLGPRGPASDDYQPRHYNRGQVPNRRQSQSDFSQPVQPPLLPQQGYMPAPRNLHGEYPGSYTNQPIHSPNSSLQSRKRNLSHSSQGGSYGSQEGSVYGPTDEPALKRMKSEASGRSEGSDQSSLYGQPYTLQPSTAYGGRQYPEASPTASFSSFSQLPQPGFGSYGQNPQPGIPQPSQNYSPYGQSAQITPSQPSGFTPRRLDTSFSNPQAAPSYDSPIIQTRSATSTTPQTQNFPRSPASAQAPTSATSYGFPTPQQSSYGLQQQPQISHGHPSQPQYMTQLQQPIPQSRAAANSLGGMNMYQQEGGTEPRPGLMGLSEMPPPLFGGVSGRGMGGDTLSGMAAIPSSMTMGIPLPGPGVGAQLPSPGGSGSNGTLGRGWGGGLDQYGRQRGDHGR